MAAAFCVMRALVKLHNADASAEGQRTWLVRETILESTGCSSHLMPLPLMDSLRES